MKYQKFSVIMNKLRQLNHKVMPGKICCIFNLAPHYRASIYKLMDVDLKCDFYIGDRISYPIDLMKYESLNGFKKRLGYKAIIGNFYWQRGAVSLIFKPYKHYLLTGDPHCISTWLILLLTKLTSKKTHLWTHGWYGDETWFKKILKKVFFGLADSILLFGGYAKSLMIKEGFNPQKLLTIYNSLDYDKQIQIRDTLKNTYVYKEFFKNQYPVLLYIGRIQSRKKIELIIEAMHKLQKSDTFYNLIIIGKQTDENNIHKLVSRYKLDKYVWFFGPCYDESILGELIYNADVCVSPGNVGLTAIHSLVYGTPVITHNNSAKQMPEFEAIKQGVTGDFFIEDSVGDLCKKLVTWTSLEKERRLKVRERCYEEIRKNYNPHKQLETLKSILK